MFTTRSTESLQALAIRIKTNEHSDTPNSRVTAHYQKLERLSTIVAQLKNMGKQKEQTKDTFTKP